MRILKFYGYSDDTFGEYGETGQDVDNCGSLEPVQCIVDCGEQGKVDGDRTIFQSIVE